MALNRGRTIQDFPCGHPRDQQRLVLVASKHSGAFVVRRYCRICQTEASRAYQPKRKPRSGAVAP